MKKLNLTTFFVFIVIGSMFGQKVMFADTEYILSKIPAHESAIEQIEESSKLWQKEIEQKFDLVQEKYNDYQTEHVLLSPEMKKKREEEIVRLEKEANGLKDKYFGDEGELYQKRKELIKPIQDEVYNAIKEIAAEGNYGYIMDKASNPSLLYADSKYDVSDEVLKKLGYN
ncbi:MAG: OmpH family outer membrane protein [Bacteroidota bacterium]|nr:OmpH family outer membrane protein [Bacteroidota bacterium]